MRSLHSLLLFVALGLILACGNERQNERPLHDIPAGMAGMVLLVDHVSSSVNRGDPVAVIFVCDGRETTVVQNATVTQLPPHDAHTTNVSLVLSPEEATAFTTAIRSSECSRSAAQYMTLKQLPRLNDHGPRR
jgi:hypothetical protein